MADTTIHFFSGESYKVKLANESERKNFVEAYINHVEDEKENSVFLIHREAKPSLIVPVKVLREQTYLETA